MSRFIYHAKYSGDALPDSGLHVSVHGCNENINGQSAAEADYNNKKKKYLNNKSAASPCYIKLYTK